MRHSGHLDQPKCSVHLGSMVCRAMDPCLTAKSQHIQSMSHWTGVSFSLSSWCLVVRVIVRAAEEMRQDYVTIVAGFVDGFPDLAYSFAEKDILGLTHAVATTFGAIISIPWSIKPFYGAIADMVSLEPSRQVTLAHCRAN